MIIEPPQRPGGLQQPQTKPDPLSNLAKLLNLRVGETVAATVEKVSAVSAEQRQTLLARYQNAAQPNSTGAGDKRSTSTQTPASVPVPGNASKPGQPLTPGTPGNLGGGKIPAAVEKLLQSPLLQLVQLRVKQQSQLSFTDKPLQAQQTVSVKLLTPQQLVITDLQAGPRGSGNINSNASANINNSAINSAVNSSIDKSTATAAISSALRSALPRQQPLQPLLQALDKLSQLPPAQLRLLPSKSQQLLQHVLQQLPSAQKITQPQQIKTAIDNSGAFLESKLQQRLAGPTAQPPTQPQSAYQLQSRQPLLNTPLAATGNSGAGAASIDRDLKGLLLRLQSSLTQHPEVDKNQRQSVDPAGVAKLIAALSGSAPAITASTAQPGLPGNSPADLLLGLLGALQLNPRRQLTAASSAAIRQQLLPLLQQQLLGGIAKLQQQQLHSLSHQQGLGETASQQSINLELPLRWGSELQTVGLRIDEQWQEEPGENEQKTEKVRCWEVMLSFQLPDSGAFYAQLRIVNDSVAANLWAEHPQTLERAKQQLRQLREQLQQQGVEVSQLQCFRGQPPSKDIQLGYSLVDITT